VDFDLVVFVLATTANFSVWYFRFERPRVLAAAQRRRRRSPSPLLNHDQQTTSRVAARE